MSTLVKSAKPNRNRQAQKSRRPGVEDCRPTAIDLFSGVGGLSLGLEQAGFDVVAAVELDPLAAAAHRFNFPKTAVLLRDVRELSGAHLLAAAREGMLAHGREPRGRRRIDLICGGPPCQGFSFGGVHRLKDERNDLVFSFARLVVEVRPRYFIMENVPGLLSEKHSGIVERLLSVFRNAGYRFPSEPMLLNAADFGVPQQRKRVVLWGWAPGEEELAEPQRRGRVTVADAFSGMPSIENSPYLFETDILALDQRALKRIDSPESDYAHMLRQSQIGAGYPRVWDRTILSGCARTAHSPTAALRFSLTRAGEAEPVSRYRRLTLAGQANTLRAGTDRERGSYTPPRPIHPTLPRVITLREAARLHSYPDWFRFHATRWHAWRQLGNSVPPLLARSLGEVVLYAIGRAPEAPAEAMGQGDWRLLGYSVSPSGVPAAPRNARAQPQG